MASPEDKDLPSLAALKQHIAERKRLAAPDAARAQAKDLMRAKYAGVDFIVNVGTGGGLGYVLDMELGTKPWLLFVGLMLGMLSGFLTLLRQSEKESQKAIEEQQQKKDATSPK